MGIAALFIVGFIVMTMTGRDTPLEVVPSVPPALVEAETPAPPPDEVPDEAVMADDDDSSAEVADGGDDDSAADADADSGEEGTPDEASPDEEAPGEETPGDEEATEAAALVAVEDPTPAEAPTEAVPPFREPRTPAPVPDPTPAPGSGRAPELPIAVVSDPTPGPEPRTPAPAGTGNPWETAAATPTPAPVTDLSNPWGTAAVTDGTLVVSSQPTGAAVSVNGRLRGKTPLTLTLAFADYEVRVSLDEHASQTRVVKVVGTKPITVDVVLESLVPPAPVAQQPVIIASNPGGAVVWIDGARQGATPLTVTVSPGQHTVRLQAGGLPDCTRSLNVTPTTRNAFYDLNNCN
jgi:hypothetical protein